MDLDDELPGPQAAVPAVPRRKGKRVAAGIAGAVALLLAASVTFGGALVAAVGIAVGSAIARGRGRTFTRASSWIAAVAAVGVVLIAFFGIQTARVDAGAFKQVKQAIDSSQAHPPPPPAWLERIAPGTAARANSRAAQPNGAVASAFGIWAIVVGTVFVLGVLACFAATLGWLATLPLAYAITGRWIGAAAEQA